MYQVNVEDNPEEVVADDIFQLVAVFVTSEAKREHNQNAKSSFLFVQSRSREKEAKKEIKKEREREREREREKERERLLLIGNECTSLSLEMLTQPHVSYDSFDAYQHPITGIIKRNCSNSIDKSRL